MNAHATASPVLLLAALTMTAPSHDASATPCEDGRDNDCDGLVDFDDPYCGPGEYDYDAEDLPVSCSCDSGGDSANDSRGYLTIVLEILLMWLFLRRGREPQNPTPRAPA